MAEAKDLIMIVDDDLWQAEHLGQQLADAGYGVNIASHAPQALVMLDEAVPECIVLDIDLPGVNGIAFLHELRSHQDLVRVPVVVCTNLVVELDELKHYGVAEVIRKSDINYGDIVKSIQRLDLWVT